ncbi:MAG: alpha/beta fold hydrolase [Rhodobacteraceae bacterium]|nr:alpha/beta fold hydrolase [Paracoccaceae bacterium]
MEPTTSERSTESEAGSHVARRDMLSAMLWSGSAVAAALQADNAQAQTQPGSPSAPLAVDRAFIRIREGLVHYRTAGQSRGGKLPLYMVHGGPGSSRGLETIVGNLGRNRRVIAADTLGYGDSAAPEPDVPEIEYYTDSVLRILDALGIEKVDYYGSHTGAHIGTELAIRAPDRVRRLIFDGVTMFAPEERDDYLANYAPAIKPDMYGRQLTWAWHFVRDMSLFFPHFRHDASHRLPRGLPSAEGLHNSVLDVLKALTTYHKSYNAVFRHKFDQRLPLVEHEVLCITRSSDPNMRYLEAAAALLKNAKTEIVDGSRNSQDVASVINGFLDA